MYGVARSIFNEQVSTHALCHTNTAYGLLPFSSSSVLPPSPPPKSVDVFAAKIRADPKLANGFNAVGFSQGNSLIRGYIQKYVRVKSSE